MEAAFGADFSGVRIHTGAEADAVGSALNARAFTAGQDIFFREGEYDAGSAVGRELLAHELAHVLQQGSGAARDSLTISEPGDVYEQEADRMAQAVMQQERQTAPEGKQSASESAGHQSGTRTGTGVRDQRKAQEKQGEGAAASSVDTPMGEPAHQAPKDDAAKQAVGGAAGSPERPNIGLANAAVANPAQTVRPQLRSGPRLSLQPDGPAKKPTPAPKGPGKGPAPAPAPAPPTVSIATVNAPGTPPAVKRIPPRVDTDVAVTVTGTAATPVTLSIDGASAANGTATINGAPTRDITGTETVKLKGVDQTTPGNAAKLKLVANQGATRLADSNAFSVAAYPKEIGFKFDSISRALPDAGKLWWGAAYNLTFVSDSGVPGDCDKTKISENILVDKLSGIWAGLTPITSDFFTTTLGQTDHHETGAVDEASMKSQIDRDPSSEAILHQFFRFSCERSGIAEDKNAGPKVPTSGFKISMHLSVITRTCGSSSRFVHVKKEGFANNGVAAGTVDDTGVKDAEV
jgi:hypothetical protein